MAASKEGRPAALAALIEIWAAGLAREGRLEEAAEALHDLVAKDPDRPRPRLLLARVLGQQGRYAAALAVTEGVEGVDAERLRARLESLSARDSMPVRPWRLMAISAVFFISATLLGGSLYRWLSAPGDATFERTPGITTLEHTPAAADHEASTVEFLTGWTRIVRELEALPPIHRVHLRPEIRDGSAVAVLEGEVISDSIARKLRHSLAVLGLEVDLSGLNVASRYRVSAGDNLSLIAWRIYGDGAQWSAIWEANRGAVADPDRIAPGNVLVIP